MADRLVRDELLTSERYCAVTNDAKLVFIHLLLAADDFGNFSGKNFTIRARCFPGEAVLPERMDKWLTELVDVDLIRFYEVDDERYVHIPRFRQRLRAMRPKYPLSPWTTIEEKQYLNSQNVGQTPDIGQAHDRSMREKRREEKRREERNTGANRASRLPEDFSLPKEWADFCRERRPDLDPAETFRRFHDYWTGLGGSKACKTDWLKTWRNWVRAERVDTSVQPTAKRGLQV